MLPTFMLRLCFVPNSTFRKKMFFLKYRIDCFLRFNKLVAFVTFAKVKPGDGYDKQYQPKFQLSDVVPFSDQGVFEGLLKFDHRKFSQQLNPVWHWLESILSY